jgi:hypothetical protein
VAGGPTIIAGTGGVASGAGGSVGRGGNLGRGGGSGRGGSGGQGTCGPTEQPPTGCPASLCGNGVRESCRVSWGYYPFCQQATFVEACEGKDLGFQSCEGIEGFASGTLRCSPSCTLDTRGCTECTTDPAIIRCGVSPLPFEPALFALGASDTEVGVVAATLSDDNLAEITFTRLAATLDGLSKTVIVEPALRPTDQFGYAEVLPQYLFVTPLPSGWVVGISTGPELYLHVLDAAGEDVGRFVIGDFAGFAFFVRRPDSGPVLVWAVQDAYTNDYRASVIAADGSAMTTPVSLPHDGAWVVEVGSGAYLDGAVYVPYNVSDSYNDPQLRIARIGADGAVSAVLSPFAGQRIMQPSLTAGHGHLRLNYTGVRPYDYYYYGQAFSQSLTATGAAIGAAVPVDLAGAGLLGWPFSVGGDTVYDIVGTSGDSIELLRLNDDGEAASRSQIVRPTFVGFEWIEVAPRGPDVVLGWFVAGRHQLRLARVTP